MASELSISLIFGASAGAAMSVINSLKGVMGQVADATKNLKSQRGALGKPIEASAKQPGPALDALLVVSHAGKQGFDGQVFIPGCRPTIVIRPK